MTTAELTRPKAKAVKAAVTGKQTTGAIIDELWALRDQKRDLEADVKKIEAKVETLTATFSERLDAEGLDKATGKKASASFSSAVTANVEDWTTFMAYVYKNKYGHLLQRRVSDVAYRELIDAGKKVPGVQPFIKKRLNLSSLA